GKYPNRNVMDGYAGISRGVEQRTVRASRRLEVAPELTAAGPIHYEVEEPRTEITPDTWVSTRDHSWGVRYDVGLPPRDLEPRDPLAGLSFRMIWSPVAMERPDGTRYGLFLHYQIVAGPGFTYKQVVMGGVEHPDGTIERFVDLEPAL